MTGQQCSCWSRGLGAALSTVAIAVALGAEAGPELAARADPERDSPVHVTAAAEQTAACGERVYDRLFFGFGVSGNTVSEEDWKRFLAVVVTPRFPNGLTVFHARGQWRAIGELTVMVESSRVVEIAHDDTPEFDQRLGEVIAMYKQRHRQQSVMRTRSRVEVCW